MVELVSAGLLLFWGAYFSLAGTGNVANWLTDHGYKGRFFRSSSRNFELMEKVARRHGAGRGAVKGMFLLIMSWELSTAAAYLAALVLFLEGSVWLLPFAFFLGMGLFAGIILGNEAFVYYNDEEEHVVMFLAQLVSYIAIVVL